MQPVSGRLQGQRVNPHGRYRTSRGDVNPADTYQTDPDMTGTRTDIIDRFHDEDGDCA